jgi:hypothetical protein
VTWHCQKKQVKRLLQLNSCAHVKLSLRLLMLQSLHFVQWHNVQTLLLRRTHLTSTTSRADSQHMQKKSTQTTVRPSVAHALVKQHLKLNWLKHGLRG